MRFPWHDIENKRIPIPITHALISSISQSIKSLTKMPPIFHLFLGKIQTGMDLGGKYF